MTRAFRLFPRAKSCRANSGTRPFKFASSKLQAGALNGGHACPVESEPHTGPPYQSPMLARADLTFSSAFRVSGPRLGPRTRGPMIITEVRLKRTLCKPHRPIVSKGGHIVPYPAR